ncbi:hypothetical protein [Catenulispora subtropica]|uniref:Condensation domain protein n=1 Tax=Catenulispora subtropica TaxID=450798 RepID=A0ABN2TCP3_9ACTN
MSVGVDVAETWIRTALGPDLDRIVLAACPDVQACVAVPRPHPRLDLVVTLRADADPHAAWDEAILAALPRSMAKQVGRIHVVTDEWLVRGPAWNIDRPATRRRFQDFDAGLWLPGLGPGYRPEPAPAERLRVPFAGPGSGRAALTWGQRDIWATMIRQRNWLPQGGRRPLAPGTRAEDVAAELAYLHSRYPAMRTRLAVGESLGVHQWVVASGETFLEFYDTPGGQDPDVFAAGVEAVYRRRPYDLRTEWPIRMAVIRTDGVCTHLVVLMHHLALDAGGAAVMLREVAARETREPTGLQPLEQAAWQASAAGQRHNDRTLRSFAQALAPRSADTPSAGPSPASTVPGPGPAPQVSRESRKPQEPRAPGEDQPPATLAGPRRPRHWSGRLTSPDLAASVAAISARTGVDDSAVLTALVAVAFARLTGERRVLLRPRVANRFRPTLADVVCFVAQSGLLVLDLGGATFDDAVDRARRATMAAMKNAYFDPGALDALLDRADGGVVMFFNDRRSAKPAVSYATEAAPDPRDPQIVRGRSVFAWLHRGPEPTEPLSVTLDDADGALALSLHFDTHVLSPDVIEALAWGVEQAAREAEGDGNTPTGL